MKQIKWVPYPYAQHAVGVVGLDQDPSNLLPMCEETTARSVGSVEDCRNYNSLENGPNAGSCNLYDYPETIDSAQCAEQRCMSMEGCVFTPGTQSGCYSEEYIDESIEFTRGL